MGLVLVAATLAGMAAGCPVMKGKPFTTLDLSAGYGYAPEDSRDGIEGHHQYGVTGRVQHDDGKGILAGLAFSMLQGQRVFRTPDSGAVRRPTAGYALGSVTPYMGLDSEFLSLELGLNLYLGGNGRDLRMFPLPFLTVRVGDQQDFFFEIIAGPERGVLDGTIAVLGVGLRWGERNEFLFRGGMAFTLTPSVAAGPIAAGGFTFIEPENPPIGVVSEFSWVGTAGLGVFTRVVAAESPTVLLGLAVDIRQLTGADD